jgi:hypothetical protein
VAILLIRLSWVSKGLVFSSRLELRLPHGYWKSLIFVAALRHDCMDAPWVINGSVNDDIFTAYVQKVFIPTLGKGDLLILLSPEQ